MIKKLNALKNQKGMTLVELLAVMVIIGIIAAISIPAIGNLLENTRKDAVVADAQTIQDAARLLVTGEDITYATTESQVLTVTTAASNGANAVFTVTDAQLVTAGYLDAELKNPKKDDYSTAQVVITITKDGKVSYSTTLTSTAYSISGDAKTLKRESVS